MKETRRRPEEAAPTGNTRLGTSRTLLWGMAAAVILALAVAAALHRRRPAANPSDPFAAVPFRPRVTYESSDVAVSNTEGEPYLDTSLHLYVGAIRYSARVGTIRPGETVKRSLRSLTNEHGESFAPGAPRTSQLEVRARFGGYEVHKDFPPPP